jgi:plastocyanin
MRAHSYRWLLPFLLIVSTSTLGAYRWVSIGDCYSDNECDEDFGFCTPVPSSFIGTCFQPDALTIAVGDYVTFWVSASFINTGPHNVVADDGSFRCALGCDGAGGDGTPRDVTSRWSFTRAFDRPGTVKYHDEVSGLAGVINVVGSTSLFTAVAVEYYYADWNFYFVTATPDEIAALDGGAFGGVWKRTGQSFDVWTDATDGALPTCRFFSTSFAPKSSHFYTPYPAECASLQAGTTWQFEGIAFYLQLPGDDGFCPDGSIPLYRLFNNGMGGAPNHRYTNSVTILGQMLANGWSFEGNGTTKVFACVPEHG